MTVNGHMPLPKVVGSTGNLAFDHGKNGSSEDGKTSHELLPPSSNNASFGQDRSNFFSQAQWTADGTTMITNSADQHIRTYIVPPDLLHESKAPHTLEPFSTIPSTNSVYATTIYPGFNLQELSTTLVLSSAKDHPLHLRSVLDGTLVASYPHVNENTEAYICPHSLSFTSDGTKFLAGSDSLISVFDVSRPGCGPLAKLPTIPSKRRRNLGGGVGMKGIVSALAIETTTSILAAGTFTGHIGLYNHAGEGDTIGTFSLAGSQAHKTIGGRGVTQLKWSPCGTYLYVAERMSDGLLVYDIRNTGQLLGWLEGRKANTNQRLSFDVFSSDPNDKHEVWAGGMDGHVRIWTDPHMREGGQAPQLDWHAHNDAVTASTPHPSGSVAATSSGQRHFDNSPTTQEMSDGSESEEETMQVLEMDNSLKLWDLRPLNLDGEDFDRSGS